jgi:hypothetical protein
MKHEVGVDHEKRGGARDRGDRGRVQDRRKIGRLLAEDEEEAGVAGRVSIGEDERQAAGRDRDKASEESEAHDVVGDSGLGGLVDRAVAQEVR